MTEASAEASAELLESLRQTYVRENNLFASCTATLTQRILNTPRPVESQTATTHTAARSQHTLRTAAALAQCLYGALAVLEQRPRQQPGAEQAEGERLLGPGAHWQPKPAAWVVFPTAPLTQIRIAPSRLLSSPDPTPLISTIIAKARADPTADIVDIARDIEAGVERRDKRNADGSSGIPTRLTANPFYGLPHTSFAGISAQTSQRAAFLLNPSAVHAARLAGVSVIHATFARLAKIEPTKQLPAPEKREGRKQRRAVHETAITSQARPEDTGMLAAAGPPAVTEEQGLVVAAVIDTLVEETLRRFGVASVNSSGLILIDPADGQYVAEYGSATGAGSGAMEQVVASSGQLFADAAHALVRVAMSASGAGLKSWHLMWDRGCIDGFQDLLRLPKEMWDEMLRLDAVVDTVTSMAIAAYRTPPQAPPPPP